MERWMESMGFVSLIVMWFILIVHCLDCTYAENSEVDALIAWKNLLKHNPQLDSWGDNDVNPCNWFHVTCDGANTVTRIDLGNAGLSGPLSPKLSQLKNLQYLEVYQNNLNGQIPPELSTLADLVSLDLYSNKLNGTIPDKLGNLQKLNFLRLYGNDLSGLVPEGLKHIAVLRLFPNGNLCDPSKSHCKKH